jgi:hypothetical protein
MTIMLKKVSTTSIAITFSLNIVALLVRAAVGLLALAARSLFLYAEHLLAGALRTPGPWTWSAQTIASAKTTRGRLLLQDRVTSTTGGATRRPLRCTYSAFAGRLQHSAQNLSSKVAGRSVLALTTDTTLTIAAARTKSTTLIWPLLRFSLNILTSSVGVEGAWTPTKA